MKKFRMIRKKRYLSGDIGVIPDLDYSLPEKFFLSLELRIVVKEKIRPDRNSNPSRRRDRPT